MVPMNWFFAWLRTHLVSNYEMGSRFRRVAPALLALIMALAFTGSRAVAAPSRAETNAWNKLRNLSSEDAASPMAWAVVETNCEKFIQSYPNSEHAGDVLGIEAQALFKQEKYDALIEKFSSNGPPNAVKAADQLAYWTARAYSKKQNYRVAADTFARLARDYPTSLLRLEAIYRECEAYSKLQEWQQVVEELNGTNAAFQQLARANANDQWVVSGMLLLGEAELARTNYNGAKKALSGIAVQTQRAELEWERQFLLCRTTLADRHAKEALLATTNLLAAASGNSDWKARSILLTGEIFERLGKTNEAVQTYETNVNSELPPVWRRQAMGRMVELMLRQGRMEDAAQKLADYLSKFPGEKDSDLAWLISGELALKKDYLAAQTPASATGQGTNLLQQAEEDFNKVLKGSTNSEYTGRAELDLGWCYTKEGKIPESLIAFSNAVEHLPFSVDQAVARFKLADAFLLQTNAGAAMTNYLEIIERFGDLAPVRDGLFEQTLYQLVRASLAQTNLEVASNSVSKLLTWFPDSLLADPSELLLGQAQRPVDARKAFSELEIRHPKSPLLPELKLAEARTFEKETNWLAALASYDGWVRTYTNDPSLPRAEFARAWATCRAGNESNAFLLFTNFVFSFQTNAVALTNDLPARAQYWVGDYYWRQQDFQQAEHSYKEIFTKWPDSSLAMQAKMMAGHAAYQGQRPQDAMNYFGSLASDSNCPLSLKAQAAYWLGEANRQLPQATGYSNAMQVFYQIAISTNYTNTAIAAKALGRLGDCYFALNGDDAVQGATNAALRRVALQRYENASNYFDKAMKVEQADVNTRSLAEIRLGQTLAAMSALEPVDDREKLLREALDHFYNILYAANLRDNENADLSCVKDAGLEAGRLAMDMGDWQQAKRYYRKLLEMMPSLQAVIEKKIAYAEAQENAQKK